MTKVALLSDTHFYMGEDILKHLRGCDEIWHAGDFGSLAVATEIEAATGIALKGVYGNIDGADIRGRYPESLVFDCEGVRVFMVHIGGYPGRYAPGIKDRLARSGAALFISGHSHILKIIYDDKLGCLHMNPGAAGRQGWHAVRTLIRFSIEGKQISDCRVIEMGKRSAAG